MRFVIKADQNGDKGRNWWVYCEDWIPHSSERDDGWPCTAYIYEAGLGDVCAGLLKFAVDSGISMFYDDFVDCEDASILALRINIANAIFFRIFKMRKGQTRKRFVFILIIHELYLLNSDSFPNKD